MGRSTVQTRHGWVPRRARAFFAPIALGVSLVLVWLIATSFFGIEAWRLPSPQLTISRAAALFSTPVFWSRIAITVLEALVGCAAGSAVAIPLSVLIHRCGWVRDAVEPFLGATQAIPAIAIAPLLVLWLGYGIFPIGALCALIVFFPILVSSVLGLRMIDRDVIDAAALDGASGWSLLRQIQLPLAAPAMMAGVRNGFTLSFTGAIVGEMVMGGEGLGQVLMQSRQSLDTASMFVVIAVLCVLSASIYQCFRVFEARLFRER